MTESEWLKCDNSGTMLEFVRPRTTRRKLGLFAAACFRRLKGLLPDPRQHQAVEMLEDMPEDREARRGMIAGVRHALPPSPNGQTTPTDDPYFVGLMLCRELVSSSTAHHASLASAGLADGSKEQQEQTHLLRCIFGPLAFHHITLDSSLITPTVTALAQAIHDERTFDRLPILADALEDAGCADADILAHCRGPGPHVRGCWAINLVLAKE